MHRLTMEATSLTVAAAGSVQCVWESGCSNVLRFYVDCMITRVVNTSSLYCHWMKVTF